MAKRGCCQSRDSGTDDKANGVFTSKRKADSSANQGRNFKPDRNGSTHSHCMPAGWAELRWAARVATIALGTFILPFPFAVAIRLTGARSVASYHRRR